MMMDAEHEAASAARPRSLWRELHGTWLRQSPISRRARPAPPAEDGTDHIGPARDHPQTGRAVPSR